MCAHNIDYFAGVSRTFNRSREATSVIVDAFRQFLIKVAKQHHTVSLWHFSERCMQLFHDVILARFYSCTMWHVYTYHVYITTWPLKAYPAQSLAPVVAIGNYFFLHVFGQHDADPCGWVAWEF